MWAVFSVFPSNSQFYDRAQEGYMEYDSTMLKWYSTSASKYARPFSPLHHIWHFPVSFIEQAKQDPLKKERHIHAGSQQNSEGSWVVPGTWVVILAEVGVVFFDYLSLVVRHIPLSVLDGRAPTTAEFLPTAPIIAFGGTNSSIIS